MKSDASEGAIDLIEVAGKDADIAIKKAAEKGAQGIKDAEYGLDIVRNKELSLFEYQDSATAIGLEYITPVLDNTVNFMTGWADALTAGGFSYVVSDDWLRYVDYESNAYYGGQAVGVLHSFVMGGAAGNLAHAGWAFTAVRVQTAATTAFGMYQTSAKIANGEKLDIWDYLNFAPAAGFVIGKLTRGLGIFRCFVAETPVATGWTEIGTATVGPLNEAAEDGLSVGWVIAGAVTVVAIGSHKKTRKKKKLKRTSPTRKRSNIDEPNPNRYDPNQIPSAGTEPTMTTEQEQAFAQFTDFREDETPTMNVRTLEDSDSSEESKPWLRKLLLAVPLLFACFCFWQALPNRVTSPQSAQAISVSTPAELQRQVITKRIDQMQPTDWVLANNPTGEEDLEFGRIVDPESWRLLQLEAPKDDGSVSEIQMVRPLWWLEVQWHEHQKSKEIKTDDQPFDSQQLVSESIYIKVPECGIDGWAMVLGIGKCPQISPRPGPEFQLVTATFKHHAKQILDVHIAGEKDSLGTTPNHPFWSEDKQQFIRADELTPGERLQKADGTLTTVTQITPRADANTVFNLEVQLNHTYHVGKTGVLVHNGNTCSGGGGLNLFKWNHFTSTRSTGWKKGDYFLRLKNLGKPSLNWKQNAIRLRAEMGKGRPIYDSYLRKDGRQRVTGGFLKKERELLESEGWIFEILTGAYHPPSGV